MKKRFIRLVLVLLGLGLLFQAASAAENETKDYSNEPWERAALYLGAFIVDMNSDLELGLGGGALSVKVDAEEVLGLEKNFTVFRADGFWRITRRNRVDFTFYQLKRDGDTFLGINIPGFGPIGSRVKTDFDMSILRGSYAWSFFKNEHFDLGMSAGLYGMNVDFKIQNQSPGTGNVKWNAEPWPGPSDSTQMRPPWTSTMRLASASPMPVPSVAASSRSKRPKTFSW